jgi:hypothetical protein
MCAWNASSGLRIDSRTKTDAVFVCVAPESSIFIGPQPAQHIIATNAVAKVLTLPNDKDEPRGS